MRRWKVQTGFLGFTSQIRHLEVGPLGSWPFLSQAAQYTSPCHRLPSFWLTLKSLGWHSGHPSLPAVLHSSTTADHSVAWVAMMALKSSSIWWAPATVGLPTDSEDSDCPHSPPYAGAWSCKIEQWVCQVEYIRQRQGLRCKHTGSVLIIGGEEGRGGNYNFNLRYFSIWTWVDIMIRCCVRSELV